jgi:hypothetical protein
MGLRKRFGCQGGFASMVTRVTHVACVHQTLRLIMLSIAYVKVYILVWVQGGSDMTVNTEGDNVQY